MIRRLWSELGQIVVVLAIVLVTRAVVAQPFYVPSGSMEPTLQIGDELLASKFAYGFSRYSLPVDLPPSVEGRLLGKAPRRGDVVVFRLPRAPDEVYVKRVIGLPGDRIRMQDGHLIINGERLPLRPQGEDTVELQDGHRVPALRLIETLPGGREHPILKLTWNGPLDNAGEFVVPAGRLFMMGDDRDNSLDSRVAAEEGGVGFVPMENLIGRADVILGSWDFPVISQPVSAWLSGLRLSRFFSLVS
jgi:signal peptidase I